MCGNFVELQYTVMSRVSFVSTRWQSVYRFTVVPILVQYIPDWEQIYLLKALVKWHPNVSH